MMLFFSTVPDKIIKIYFRGSFLMSWQEKFNVITVSNYCQYETEKWVFPYVKNGILC